jgi:ATP-dependent exoDNAse (exonuclease V) beta subunit
MVEAPAAEPPATSSDGIAGDFAPLVDASHTRLSVADSVGRTLTAPQAGRKAPPCEPADRLIGTLTHRLLQRFGFGGARTVDAGIARGLLRTDEVDGSGDAIERALATYRSLCERPDVRLLYESGDRLHEVSFTMFVDGSFVRGAIDCVVRTSADGLTVLEFKTGRPRDEHRAQLDLYRRAVEQLFPGCRVDARLIYADEVRAS